jgi:hypothetical protein
MPVGYIFVCHASRNIKHDDSTLPVDVVTCIHRTQCWLLPEILCMRMLFTISQSTEFLLAGGIPNIEHKWTSIGVKQKWVHFDPDSGDVFLFKFSLSKTM